MSYTCKKCETKYTTITNLRKHQWKFHREAYANVGNNLQPVVRLEPTAMSALELIEKLKKQRDFIIDVVALLEAQVK